MVSITMLNAYAASISFLTNLQRTSHGGSLLRLVRADSSGLLGKTKRNKQKKKKETTPRHSQSFIVLLSTCVVFVLINLDFGYSHDETSRYESSGSGL